MRSSYLRLDQHIRTMGNRITGLIRYFVGLVSPSYVPETPLPRDPGKSASLPLAEALIMVEPGATATSGKVVMILCLAILLELTLVNDKRTDGRTDGYRIPRYHAAAQ